jgi:hypothetical protein
MRRAYDVRSAIIHGGTPDPKVLRNLADEHATVEALADDLEDVLRRAVQAAIRALVRGHPFPPEWERLVFVLPEAEEQ